MTYHKAIVYLRLFSLNITNELLSHFNQEEFGILPLHALENIVTLKVAINHLRKQLLIIQDILKDENKHDKNELSEKICKYLQENYNDISLSLESVSNILHVSTSHASRSFRHDTDLTFTRYLTKLRLKKACELIENTDLPFADICNDVGILSRNYFYTLFRKEYGMTPKQYRNLKNGAVE